MASLRGFAHTGVTVSDLDTSLQFYATGLGLRLANRRRVDDAYIRQIVQVSGLSAIEVALLQLPDGPVVVELLQYDGGDGTSASTRPCDPGSGHLCLYVDDIGTGWRQALACGGRPRTPRPTRIDSGPFTGGFGCYLSDPDGYLVELLQPPTEVTREDHRS